MFLFIAGLIVIVYPAITVTAANNPSFQEIRNVQPTDESPKRKVAVACFSNETKHNPAVSPENTNDPLGRQAMDILTLKLEETGKFIVAERRDMNKILENLRMPENNVAQEVGAEYILVGAITGFSDKKVGKTDSRLVETTVKIRLVEVLSGKTICSGEGKGECEWKGTAKSDSKNESAAVVGERAIDEAISKLIEPIVKSCSERPWKTFIVNYDLNGIVIAGGENQGLKFDDVLEIVEKAKTVENPQTGETIELPEKVVGKIQIVCFAGNTPENKFALTSLIEGDFDTDHLNRYFIQEIKNQE